MADTGNDYVVIATLPSGIPVEVNIDLLADGVTAWARSIVAIEMEYKEADCERH